MPSYLPLCVACLAAAVSGAVTPQELSNYEVRTYLELTEALGRESPDYVYRFCWDDPEDKFRWRLSKYLRAEYREFKPAIITLKPDWKIKWFSLLSKYCRYGQELRKTTYETWADEDRCEPLNEQETRAMENFNENMLLSEPMDEAARKLDMMDKYLNTTLRLIRPVLEYTYYELLYRARTSVRGPYRDVCLGQSKAWLEERVQSSKSGIQLFINLVQAGRVLNHGSALGPMEKETSDNLRHLWKSMKNALMWNCVYVDRFGTIDTFIMKIRNCSEGLAHFHVRKT